MEQVHATATMGAERKKTQNPKSASRIIAGIVPCGAGSNRGQTPRLFRHSALARALQNPARIGRSGTGHGDRPLHTYPLSNQGSRSPEQLFLFKYRNLPTAGQTKKGNRGASIWPESAKLSYFRNFFAHYLVRTWHPQTTAGSISCGLDDRGPNAKTDSADCDSACCTSNILCAAPTGSSCRRGLREHSSCDGHDDLDRTRGFESGFLRCGTCQSCSRHIKSSSQNK